MCVQSAHTHCRVRLPNEAFPPTLYTSYHHVWMLSACARHIVHCLRTTCQVRLRLLLCLLRISETLVACNSSRLIFRFPLMKSADKSTETMSGVFVSSSIPGVVVEKKDGQVDELSSYISIHKVITKELEEVKQRNDGGIGSVRAPYYPFPEASLKFLRSIPGNNACADCGAQDPQWASISYGVLVCTLTCSPYSLQTTCAIY